MMSPLMAAALAAWIPLGTGSTAVPAGYRQGLHADPHPAVVVALMERLPDSTARAVVIRRLHSEPRDVILLRAADASTTDLTTAIALLVRSQAEDGDRLPHDLRITVRASAPVHAPSPATLRYLSGVLEDARRAPVRPLSGVGAARATTLSLERFRHRPG